MGDVFTLEKVITITLGLLAICCKPTEHRITGTYNKYTDFENWYSLKVNKNQEFEFIGQEGLQRIQTKGRWELKGDTLILNSLGNDKPSTINFAKVLPSNKVIINVSDIDGLPIEGVFVTLTSNGITTEKRTETNGRSIFPNVKYDSLDVGFLGYQRLSIKVPLDSSNQFNIKLMTDYTTFYQLKNQYFKVKWRRLIANSFPSDNSKQVLRK